MDSISQLKKKNKQLECSAGSREQIWQP